MLGSLVLLWICFYLLYSLIRIRPKNFPPGPLALPILGNMLNLNPANPLKDLERLSEQYGKVFSLYIGGKPAVILNGLEATKEALVTKAVDFAGRPQNLMVNHVRDGQGIVLADYGPDWREQRRFILMTLRNFGLGKQSMEERILGEVSHIIARLEKSVGSSMNPQPLFYNGASNVIFSVLFGSRFEYDDKFLKLFIQIFRENSKIANGPWAMLYDAVPLVRSLPLPFTKAFTNVDIAEEMITNLLKEHEKTRIPGEPRDFADCYTDELNKRGENVSSFNHSQLINVLMDLHFAGTDTTSNTLLTTFLYLMTHPEVQERCQQEIDTVLEGKALVSFEDRHNMPYTHAMIHESQRISNTVPLSVFHSTTRDTEVMGYSIPKDTLIIPNLTSVLKEEGQWKFPHSFNPDNFLDDQGQFVKPEAFLPFSLGPRVCLGEGLARMELFLVVVSLLRRFRFVWPEDAGEPDYTPVFGVTLSPQPYRLGVRLRENQ